MKQSVWIGNIWEKPTVILKVGIRLGSIQKLTSAHRIREVRLLASWKSGEHQHPPGSGSSREAWVADGERMVRRPER